MKNKIIWSAALLSAVVLAGYFLRETKSSQKTVGDGFVAAISQKPVAPISTLSGPAKLESNFAVDIPEKSSSSAVSEERIEVIKRAINFGYGKAMLGLNLTSTEVEKLRGYLVEKAEAGDVASDIAVATPGRTPQTVEAAVTYAKAQVDDEMRAYFGDEKFAEIELMQKAVAYLAMERTELDPQLQKEGVTSLDPAQVLKLATAMAESYGWGIETIRPTSKDPATGLTDRDLVVLGKAAEFLTTEQLSVLKTILMSRNKYSHIAKPS